MYGIERLQGVNFRSFEQLDVDFAPGVNALLSANGTGKTNLLDMVHYLCLTRAARRYSDRQALRHEAKSFALYGHFTLGDNGNLATSTGTPDEAGYGIDVSLGFSTEGGKIVRVQGKRVQPLAEHIGRLPIIAAFPHDVDIIHDGGDLKRRFLNSGIAQFDSHYLTRHAEYQALLQRRNALLKADRCDRMLIEVLDAQLGSAAQPLYEARAAYCKALLPHLTDSHSRLIPQGKQERIELVYQPSGTPGQLEKELNNQWDNDLRFRYTTLGPHRDRISFRINGYALQPSGSQGQYKLFMLALRLAQREYYHHLSKRWPILLLDDLFDRLDTYRIQALIDYLATAPGQIFITHAGPEPDWTQLFQNINQNRRYRILDSSLESY